MEWSWERKKDIVCITIGTGIGAGIILNGNIHHGANDGAGEFGHVTIDPKGPKCNCGNYGCLETLASATAIIREGYQLLDTNKKHR